VLWDVDTAVEYATVNQVAANGGSLNHGGVTVVNGVLYVNSGYGRLFGQPGNALIAFTIDGK
jgi:polyvinyl alcohol dehydrogenase (cytochrome)